MAALAADFMNADNIPGLSIAIAIKGKPAYVEAFGVADRETGEAMTPQHRFRIASIRKTITATGIFRLIEAGKVRLDATCLVRTSFSAPTIPRCRPCRA